MIKELTTHANKRRRLNANRRKENKCIRRNYEKERKNIKRNISLNLNSVLTGRQNSRNTDRVTF